MEHRVSLLYQSLRYDFCCCANCWSSKSTNADNFAVGPETPEIIGFPSQFVDFPKGVKYWTLRRVWCLTNPFFSHFVNVVFWLWSTVINCCTLRGVSSTIGTARGLSSSPCSCMLSNWICLSFFVSAGLMNRDVVPLSAFLVLIFVLFFKSLSALCSA